MFISLLQNVSPFNMKSHVTMPWRIMVNAAIQAGHNINIPFILGVPFCVIYNFGGVCIWKKLQGALIEYGVAKAGSYLTNGTNGS